MKYKEECYWCGKKSEYELQEGGVVECVGCGKLLNTCSRCENGKGTTICGTCFRGSQFRLEVEK